MKKVLFTSHVANFAKFNYPFMQWFKEQGYEVHYASMGEEAVDCDQHFVVPFERSPFKLNNVRAIRQLKRIIDREGYDIIHTHTPMGSVVTRLAAINARKNGTRVMYTAHGFHFFKGAPLLNWIVYYPIEKIMARYVDTLLTINKEDYERAKRKLSTDVRYVSGVGIDPRKFDVVMSDAEKLELRQSLGLKKDDFVLFFVAELNDNKNQAMLLRALERVHYTMPNAQLLLAGKDTLNGKLHRMANELGIDKNIRFLGYRRDIPQLLKIADVSVSSSRREGLPVNIMEAMYAGLPVIVTACRGNSDLVLDGKNGLVIAQDDDDAAAKAITKLYHDETLRSDFGEQGKALVQPYLMDEVMREMVRSYTLETSS
jgi:glycosyltransferase EpsD